MWPRAFLDDPGGSAGADDDPTAAGAAYGSGGRKRKGAAAVQVKFFELCRDGANARTEWRKRRAGEIADPSKPKRLSNGKVAAAGGGGGGGGGPGGFTAIPVVEEEGAIIHRASESYKEALRVYTEELAPDQQNASFICGAQQNVGVTLTESGQLLEALRYLLLAEQTSVDAGLERTQNHCALCENICTAQARLRDWEQAEKYAGLAIALDPGTPALQLKSVGTSKMLVRQARHAYMMMMAGKWRGALDMADVVYKQSLSHNVVKRRAKMMLVKGVSAIELAMHTRDERLLEDGEGNLVSALGVARRAFGRNAPQVADLLELAAMFAGSVRRDQKSAETYALQAVQVREMGLKEQLADEYVEAECGGQMAEQAGGGGGGGGGGGKQDGGDSGHGGGGAKAPDEAVLRAAFMKRDLPYDSDPRLQSIMEDSVIFLKQVQRKHFLTPWRFMNWKHN
jgi:tetratricopeptide (TPR) repeat protein